MKMNESLFDNIIDTAQDCIFWKDKDRRFVGVNQSFLDFYGFESADVLIGKNDEEMGWHNDPEPYKQDELRVLAGESTYKVLGKCMVRGEERDIIATKRPIYRGGEIVGLVGSFIDVTDVMRREREGSTAQMMYNVKKLRKYPYFDKLLDEVHVEEILDHLTGVISRGYIFDYAKSLISSRTPFTFCIIDLDNFKDINDTFGHHAGDVVLMDVSRELALYTDGYGLVGRFGGDELLVINLRDIEFDEKTKFFKKMYEGKKILRKNIRYDGHDLFVTGTSGCATYPDDATDYDELFSYIDKTLYQGKNRGRNCFTVYVEEEHKHLDVKAMARRGVYTCMNTISELCEGVDGPLERLNAALPFLQDELQIMDVSFVQRDGCMRAPTGEVLEEDVSDIEALMLEDIFLDSVLDTVKKTSPLLYKTLKKRGVRAVMIVRVAIGGETFGHLICAEKNNQRLWQEDECGIVYYLTKLLAISLVNEQ
ncbi:MAG: sensor domain-containing diguanylate cyclase [Eubacterium sp.]|nr:sensor domain-containing diguanylate cyclase [Eubacterium sp.]